MDRGSSIKQFLLSRRARVQPQDVGLTDGLGRRRVPGLRREEVAQLAGVSTEYYVRLERGHISSLSANILNAVARALLLDDAEREHLFDLVGPENVARSTLARPDSRVRASLLRLLEVMNGTPAMVQNHRTDVLAANDLGHALYPYVTSGTVGSRNIARFVFLDPRSEVFYTDWDESARDSVAMLQLASGSHGQDRRLTELVGELSLKSPAFRRLWAAHDVRIHTTGVKTLRHPIVGEITVTYEALRTGDQDHTLVTYTADTGSSSQEMLEMLGGRSVTEQLADAAVQDTTV